jgi:hypothetical protein
MRELTDGEVKAYTDGWMCSNRFLQKNTVNLENTNRDLIKILNQLNQVSNWQERVILNYQEKILALEEGRLEDAKHADKLLEAHRRDYKTPSITPPDFVITQTEIQNLFNTIKYKKDDSYKEWLADTFERFFKIGITR